MLKLNASHYSKEKRLAFAAGFELKDPVHSITQRYTQAALRLRTCSENVGKAESLAYMREIRKYQNVQTFSGVILEEHTIFLLLLIYEIGEGIKLHEHSKII